MSGPTRRELLVRLALGSAGLCLTRVPVRAGEPGVDELAQRIRGCAPDAIYDVGAAALRAGADPATLLGASFLAGIRDIRPHGVGGKFHAVLMVESAFQLLAASSADERKRIALWALWDFKRCQQRDVSEEDDWELPAAPEAVFASEAAARRELAAGMAAWDVERAERAAIGLIPFHDRGSLFELFWPYGARCYADLGHKIIYCAHAERTLARIGWRHAEPVLRSLVRGLLYTDGGGRRVEGWETARELAAGFPSGWKKGENRPATSVELLRELRGLDPEASQRKVVEALAAGVGLSSVWDGLRLHAAEVFHRRSVVAERRHGPVHPVTELNAFAYIHRTTRDETMRRVALLQAAGWIARLRDDLVGLFGEQRDGTLDTLGAAGGDAVSIDEVFARPSEDAARVAIESRDDGVERYLELLRGHLYERAFQDHQYKFVAALHEEASTLHPSLRSRFLAPAITYVPAGRDEESEMSRRSRRALRG